MGKVQQTDIAAYERNVQDADEAFVLAQGAVSTARRELNERRELEGLDPIVYDDEAKAEADSKADSSKDGKK